MKDQWTDRLSEYLDAELGVAERAALEAHLADCAACAATLAELRRVVARAQALDARPPATELWPGIASRIGATSSGGARPVASLEERRARRRFTFTLPQLVAASLALVFLSGAAGWWLVRQGTGGPTTVATGTPPPAPLLTSAAASEVNPRYAAAVAELERALAQRRNRLDTTTVRVIERNLEIIDQAIRDARSALAADPGNSYLNLHLAEQMRRKVELLRRATTLASTPS